MGELDIHARIVPQYLTALEMLEEAIERCPPELWLDASYENKYWHIAYHTLFFTHLYLQDELDTFRPWSHHREHYQFLGMFPWNPAERPVISTPYTQAEVREYLAFCREEVKTRVPATRLEAPSGFHWLPFDKLGVQLYNLGHLQHHTGQLIERLRVRCGFGVKWRIAPKE